MNRNLPRLAAVLLAANAVLAAAQHARQKDTSAKTTIGSSATLAQRRRALHTLSRLTFGPTPGEVDAVMAKGLDGWIEDQLHPESLNDAALNARLAPYATTRMDAKQLALAFPSDNVIRQIAAGKRMMPTDPELKFLYSVNLMRVAQQDASKNSAAAGASKTEAEEQARSTAETLLAQPKGQRLAALENLPPEQVLNFASHLRGDQRDRLAADSTPHEREVFRALTNPAGVVTSELQQAKLMREIYSERQLLEVMTDFWMNHFNVYQPKEQCAYYTTAYERDVIRPHALGKFYDLLVATAQSPAMLIYLDNWISIGPHSQAAGKSAQIGVNENYGRELMELHTLGVDGGYTQADVSELAAALTGWTVTQPDDGGAFQFDPRRHEPGTRIIMGRKFYEGRPEQGSEQGLQALDMLAHHPATAQFISKKLAMRFVSDDPPASLVNRMAAEFLSSDGDIRAVMRTMLHSPEFWSAGAYRAKLKTPLEFIVSAVRASAANVVAPDALIQSLSAMGMQPYGMISPTGYSMESATWRNDSALLARINFSTVLTEGNLPGVRFDPNNLIALQIVTSGVLPPPVAPAAGEHDGSGLAIAVLESAILQGSLSSQDAAMIRQRMQQPDVQRKLGASPLEALRPVAGLLLASPEFQRR